MKSVFDNEVGTHYWQRIPPTEKRGRVHTSTIAVSILDKNLLSNKKVKINHRDIDIEYTCSGGKGGQNVNRRSTCVILKHKPTGIIIRSEENRTQEKNEKAAFDRLEKLIQRQIDDDKEKILRTCRYNPNKDPIKRRTYRVKDYTVVDHVSGKKASLKDILKGKIELIQ